VPRGAGAHGTDSFKSVPEAKPGRLFSLRHIFYLTTCSHGLAKGAGRSRENPTRFWLPPPRKGVFMCFSVGVEARGGPVPRPLFFKNFKVRARYPPRKKKTTSKGRLFFFFYQSRRGRGPVRAFLKWAGGTARTPGPLTKSFFFFFSRGGQAARVYSLSLAGPSFVGGKHGPF